MLYILPSYVALILLRGAESGRATVLFLMLVVWAGDIGAYLVGRLVGGPRLAPSISPGKTWSGAAGGTLCAVLAGLAVAPAHPVAACVLALVLSIVAQAGDLLESAIKRHFGVKDSGRLIPGHGGLLDRLDGVVAAAPAMLLISFLTRYG
jgi:phosphatidate cytidylyltransferase